MDRVDGFTVSDIPQLRSPIVVMSFTGWSDTGTVTTDAATQLVQSLGGQPFLEVDPEEYYVFTETRPTVRIRAVDFFKGGIETEEQLESALTGLKEKCEELIGAGKKVLIQ